MYRVLVVDDEINIAQGIAFLIKRGLPECQVVGIAGNGAEGVEMAFQLQPDIIFTDICMPEMDGLDMIRTLKEMGFKCRYIILSGFTEFEYAKSAISLGVEEYITKPVEEEILYKTFEKICCFLEQEKRQGQQQQEMESRLNEYSNDIKEYWLREVLNNNSKNLNESLRKRGMELGVPFDCVQYICVAIDIEGKTEFALQELIQSVVETYFNDCAHAYVVRYSETEYVLFLALKKRYEYRSFLMILGKIRFYLSEKINVMISFGVGIFYNTIENVGKSYMEARCAANYKVIKGMNCVISYEEIRNIPEKPGRIAEEDMKYLENCMDELDNSGCRLAVEQIFNKLEKESDITLESLQNISLGLLLVGVRKIPFAQIQLNEYLGKDLLSLDSMSKFQTMDQLKNWIINVLTGINEIMLKQGTEEKTDIVEEIKKYLFKNFNKEISLADISEKFYINPSYFSQLFKKKTGVTYQNYLISLRVKRACKLLEETGLRIYEVAELVGYSDTNYFSKIFERTVGVKPSDYRKTKVKNDSE